MSRLIKLGAVQVGGKGDGAAIPDLLLVTQANLEKRCSVQSLGRNEFRLDIA